MESARFLGEEFVFNEPLNINGYIVNNTKSLELEATVAGKMSVHCARCNKPMTVDISFPVSEILVRDDGEMALDEDVVLYSGTEVDLNEVITNSFLMNVSGKYLCSEDCKGICPHCGTNLNEHECSCNNDIIDPRWEKLAEIMKKMSDTE
ncbi:MAG: DUF177 domain-containing protein [Firmicutes bacterium]|nr:DUF177 domain-containing protein [Bacillota bacterium]